MTNQEQIIKAIGVLSSGLDSRLALKVIQAQGIQVTVLHFHTGVNTSDRARRLQQASTGQTEDRAARLSVELDAKVRILDVADEYFQSVVLHPRYGYGTGMNPCVDCRIFMLRKAKAYMQTHGAHFVFTGEVLGQRPKSQKRDQMRTVERESGLTGYLLRPLSAKHLPPTMPEQRGWVDRERLYAIKGRGRKEQIALAEQFGIEDYPQPAGGCFLTDQSIVSRLRDFMAHNPQQTLNLEQFNLLTVGRHLRLSPDLKVIIGRREAENLYLEQAGKHYWQFTTPDHPGPTALAAGPLTPDQVIQVAQVVATCSDGKSEPQMRIQVCHPDGGDTVTVEPAQREALRQLRI